MKKLLLLCLSLSAGLYCMATIHTITNVGNTFSPSNLAIQLGDTVVWNISGSHNVLEVDSSDWANNNAISNNGFSLPFGGGTHVFTSAGSFFYVCQPHASGGMKGKIVVRNITSLTEYSEDLSFSFYPNPANDQIQIELKGIQTVEEISLMTFEGKEVIKREFNNSNPYLNISGVNPGNYVLVVRSKEGILSRKIVIN